MPVYAREIDDLFSRLYPHLVDDISSYERNLELMERMGLSHEVGVDDVDAVSEVLSAADEDFRRRVVTTSSASSEDDRCPICLSAFVAVAADEGRDDDRSRSRTPLRRTVCGHVFCDGCIRTWFRMSNKCPVCRVNVSDAAQTSR